MVRFCLTQKIQFQHCGPANAVFYPRYFERINATVEEWFSHRVRFPFKQIQGKRAAATTVSLEIVFKAPSQHGEYLDFHLEPLELGRSSLKILAEVWCKSQKRLSMISTLAFILKNKWRAPRGQRICAIKY